MVNQRGGGVKQAHSPPPPQILIDCICYPILHQNASNKAQKTQENIKNPLSFQGP